MIDKRKIPTEWRQINPQLIVNRQNQYIPIVRLERRSYASNFIAQKTANQLDGFLSFAHGDGHPVLNARFSWVLMPATQ